MRRSVRRASALPGRRWNAARLKALPFLVVCALLGVVSHAHHSIAAIYDSSRQRRIEGGVTEFQFINPHPFLVLDVKGESGTNEQWKLEMDNRFELAQVGVTRETFKPGDHLVVSGSPARQQARSLYIRRLDRPSDGFWYEQAGASPRISPRKRP
jgi:hypothetical protein